MPIPSYLAILLEAGSVLKTGQGADARMIRYLCSIYPENVGVELLIQDIEALRLLAKMQEPRLAVYLEEYVNTFDLGLASKGSESAKMIRTLQREMQAQVPKSMIEKKNEDNDLGLQEINYNKDTTTDYGNQKY